VCVLQERFGVSQRRACRVTGQHRSTQRKNLRPVRSEDQRLAAHLRDIAGEHPRWGWKTAHQILLREDGRSIASAHAGSGARRVCGGP
jgi:putative transposase